MPTIKRADGAQFAIHTYRELLNVKRISLLQEEIRSLAQNQGEYVRLFKINPKQYEAVFSREPGFLLGETVWNYFNKPADLIFCEVLPEGHHAIVVVVKSGIVYLDTKIPLESIADEFAPLITSNNQYQVFIYGDVPISDTPDPEKFVFEPQFIKSFTRLEQPIFPILPAEQALQLQPLELALRTLGAGKPSKPIIAILIIILLGLFAWWYFQSTPKTVEAAKPQGPPEDPYAAFNKSMQSPSPAKELQRFAQVIDKLYLIPGWTATSVNFDGQNFQVALQPLVGQPVAGTYQELQDWSNLNKFQLTLATPSPSLAYSTSFTNRTKPNKIPQLRNTLLTFMDRMTNLFPTTGNIQLGSITNVGLTQNADITINFSQISPGVLVLMGNELTDLPVILGNVNTNIADGLLSGTIKLTVLGK